MRLTYVEIDVDYCSRTYGVSPCTAVLGVTGTKKCFNTLATCQDRPHFNNTPKTYRFSRASSHYPVSIEAIPNIQSVQFTPAVLSLGKDLGQRASVTISFTDHPWSDTPDGYDKYNTERPYNPYDLGTYWGKFRARQQFLTGRPLRLIIGEKGQDLSQMTVHHFVIDSFTGPGRNGVFSIVAKDILKLADGDKALAPTPNNGYLGSSLTSGGTTIALQPDGIGNVEYPTSGYASIGKSEIVSYTRSGDTVTVTARGLFNTVAVAHAALDAFQIALVYTTQDASNIIKDLFVTYAGIPTGYIPITQWLAETTTFNRQLYTAVIAIPTSVNKLVSELIEQAGLVVWWADDTQLINLQVLRQIATNSQTIDEDIIVSRQFEVQEQPSKRISQCLTYYGQINPLASVDDDNNYRSGVLSIDSQAGTDYITAAIKIIHSRWTPQFGRTIALRMNDIQIGRFRNAPRLVTYSLDSAFPVKPTLGAGHQLMHRALQLDTGEEEVFPGQVIRLNPGETSWDYQSEEVKFVSRDSDDLTNLKVFIDSDGYSINLRSIYDSVYPVPEDGSTITFVINSTVTIGSVAWGVPAVTVGNWPEAVTLVLINKGRIQGVGGQGGRGAIGNGDIPGTNGQQGSLALYTRRAITLDNSLGRIYSGGGGGAGAGTRVYDDHNGGGGGGGAGLVGGPGGSPGGPQAQGGGGGSLDSGGSGGYSWTTNGSLFAQPHPMDPYGGNGGAPGSDGGAQQTPGNNGWDTAPGSPGARGDAVDGTSYITYTATGDIRGYFIN